MVYFTEAARRLGASEAEANNLYPYALAWHRRYIQLLPWDRDPKCVLPPWVAPVPERGRRLTPCARAWQPPRHSRGATVVAAPARS